MQPGAKFCTKCGTPVDQNQKPAGASSVVASTAKHPQLPFRVHLFRMLPCKTHLLEKKKQERLKGIILIIVLAICALIVAILLALKATGVLSRITSGISQSTEEAADNDNNEEDEETPGEDEEEPEEDPEVAEARRQGDQRHHG